MLTNNRKKCGEVWSSMPINAQGCTQLCESLKKHLRD